MITGQGLVDKLMEQIKPFGRPSFGEMVETLDRAHRRARFPRDHRRRHDVRGKVVVIAAGGGSFQPKRPPIPGHRGLRGQVGLLRRAQDGGVPRQATPDRRRRRQRARLDAQPAADRQRLTLLHRRDEFRAAPDSVNKMRALVEEGKIDLVLGQVTGLEGEGGQLRAATVKGNDGADRTSNATRMLPFFGLTMKLGPVANWGINLTRT
jgi:thioredoxin reductase (NADPH)